MAKLASITPVTQAASGPDSGLKALALVLAFGGQPVGADQLGQELGLADRHAIAEDLVRLARMRGREASVRKVARRRLATVGLPAIAEWCDGGFVVLARVGPGEVLIHDPVEGRPKTIPKSEFEAAWTGRLVRVGPAAGREEDQLSFRRFGFGWFLPILAKYKLVLGQVALASLLLQLFGLAAPMVVMTIMDKVLTTGGLSTLDMLAIGLLVAGIFELLMGLVRGHLQAFASNRLDVELQARLFSHLSRLPVSYFAGTQTGATAARVQELQSIRSFLTGATVTTGIDLCFTVVYLAVMAHYAPVLTLIVVAIVIAIFLIYGVVTPALKTRLARKTGQAADGQAFLVETVGGIETVKSLAVEPQLQRNWEEHVAKHTRAAYDAEQLSSGMNQLVSFLSRLMTVITLWLGATLVIGGSMTAGQLMAFNMMSGRVLAPAQRLAQLWQQFQQTRISVKRIGEIMNAQRELARATAANLPDVRGRVTFDQVTFRYRPDRPEVLRRLSFDVRPGEVIGIVGSSGSGKSTIARLIQRLYAPEGGKVLIDGVDLTLVDPSWLRRRVGMVLQENFLFNRTVRENIALADPTMPLERIMEAAKLSGAHDFILALPEAYDTVVGERGATLSGGQRQRIALARALATDPRILILDEATSALDYESERVIHDNMRRISAGRTVFVIAHRLAAVRDADRILVIENGELVEEGNHADLLRRSGGRYAALHHHQVGGAFAAMSEALSPAE
ncbi:peptidase domain-containing ABC transporter [Arenibaculum pallidiluteum]|uniref:peptidase domain-containing ABC transporter n=1 Tax=Arenibaculum pallidiluteum TaxID=2812559 RepID=UPI001A96BABA|nr:type I secretion system permease/ATPase [Arenibaculum pallidiluteum]